MVRARAHARERDYDRTHAPQSVPLVETVCIPSLRTDRGHRDTAETPQTQRTQRTQRDGMHTVSTGGDGARNPLPTDTQPKYGRGGNRENFYKREGRDRDGIYGAFYTTRHWNPRMPF